MKIIVAYLLTSTAIFTACDAETGIDAEFVIEKPPSFNASSDPPKSLADMADRLSDLPLATEAFIAYTVMLSFHVDDLGFVNYDALHADPTALDTYVEFLAAPGSVPPPEDRDARLATLINAYNAFTLKLIVDNYRMPGGGTLASITDLYGGKPWDQKLWTLAGQTVSLNQLEHEMIRPVFDEPRIHWAVVCAAYSCPPLRAEAYTAADLDDQLADQERRVLLSNDPRFIQTNNRRVTAVTQLFNWYGQDFGTPWTPYVQQATGLPVTANPTFIKYHWQLNSTANRPPA